MVSNKTEIEKAYVSLSEFLLSEIEKSQTRYMEAEALLIDLLNIKNRFFVRRKILNHLRKYMCVDWKK